MNQPMTKDDIARQAEARGPASEATQIEQTRAIAQVQGALVVAQKAPRDAIAAMARIREACAHPQLAERAFFAFKRGGQSVNGPSIHFATELARCWGNIDYGIVELSRNDRKGESEMLAVAWDLETNTRISNGFMVPHRRDTKNGAKDLTDMRDIYENNANMGARRLRECILRCLPVYVREEAQQICHQVLREGGGEPIEQRREKLLAAFAELGVTQRQIEKRAGVPADRLSPVDIANLGIVYKSLNRGETTADEQFTPAHSEEVQAALSAPETGAAAEQTAEAPEAETEPPAAEEAPPPASTAADAGIPYFDPEAGLIATYDEPAKFLDHLDGGVNEAAKNGQGLDVWKANAQGREMVMEGGNAADNKKLDQIQRKAYGKAK